jgi:hypothetical protein
MKKILVGLLLTVFSLSSQAVLIGGKDWVQLTEYENRYFSYDVLVTNNICDPITGVCDGIFEGQDFSGLSWATNVEVAELFSILQNTYGESWADYAIDSQPWDPTDIEGLFNVLAVFDTGDGIDSYLYGLARAESTDTTTNVYVAGIRNDPYGVSSSEISPVSDSMTDVTFGLWMYQTLDVPEPSILCLMSVWLVGLGFSNRRKIRLPTVSY